MRQSMVLALCLGGIVLLSACADPGEKAVDETMKELNAIDSSNLNSVMLTAADPEEAVNYFKRAVKANPERVDLLRGLAQSQVRAGNNREAVLVWKSVNEHAEAEPSDAVDYADALIRAGDWDEAEKVLDSVPPTHETFKRYRLEAMIADSNKEWTKADSFYETAVGLTTTPASVLNNWGYSKLTRGDYRDAEKLFTEALRYEPDLFTAKNNLVLARSAQRNYDLPIIDMTQTERAELLYTAALAAIKQGDVVTGKNLLQQAIETHPQYFEAAVRSLAALDEG